MFTSSPEPRAIVSPMLCVRRQKREDTARNIRTLRIRCPSRILPVDLTDGAEAEKLVSATMQTFGHLDILVNSAGIIRGVPSR